MLSVRFEYDDLNLCTEEEPVYAVERRGGITYKLYRGFFLPEGVAGLNSAACGVLSGGQWFQLWGGEIISINSPGNGGRHAGVHRGPLVH